VTITLTLGINGNIPDALAVPENKPISIF